MKKNECVTLNSTGCAWIFETDTQWILIKNYGFYFFTAQLLHKKIWFSEWRSVITIFRKQNPSKAKKINLKIEFVSIWAASISSHSHRM